jgi:uncharacterized metal-binding protein YceD (DUF177 family)
MQFNVAQLMKEPTGSVRRYGLVEEISQLDPDLDVLGPLVGNVQLIRIPSGILLRGNLSTAVRLTCNRCLEPIAEQVRFELEESFRPLTEVHTGRFLMPDEYEGEEDDLEDEALLIDSHHILDISEVVRQSIWLAMPMAGSCNWTGPSDCPNWITYTNEVKSNVGGERDGQRSQGDDVDPRWAALLDLRRKLGDDDPA